MADYYFWLMSEILFFYCLTAFVVCYFFRQFCQDPSLKDEADAEEKKEIEDENKKDVEMALLDKSDTPTDTPGDEEQKE